MTRSMFLEVALVTGIVAAFLFGVEVLAPPPALLFPAWLALVAVMAAVLYLTSFLDFRRRQKTKKKEGAWPQR